MNVYSTIHIATINGDLFKLRRQLVIFKFNKWDIDIRSMDGKKEVTICEFQSHTFLIKPESKFRFHRDMQILDSKPFQLTIS